MGQPKTKAYAFAHPNARMTPGSLQTAAKRAAKTEAVQAELSRLMADPMLQPVLLEPCAEARYPDKLREHCVSVMLKLTRHPDPLVVYHAVDWIRAYADQVAAERTLPKPDKNEREKLLGELRGLYSKALNRPPIIETVAEESDSETPSET